MTKKASTSLPDVVTALMAERQTYEQWLVALDTKRTSTPEQVYARVRADYAGRLDRVTEQLSTHAAELRAQAETLSARLTELGELEKLRRDELAEGELRAHVGELTPAQWTTITQESADQITSIATEQAVVAADLNRIHELLGAATGPGSPAGTIQPSAVPAAVLTVDAVSVIKAPPVQPAAPTMTPAGNSGFDELAFLKSVVTSPAASGVPVKQEKEPPRDPLLRQAPAVIGPDQEDALVSRVNRPSVQREFLREEESEGAGGLLSAPQEPRRSTERPFAANVTGNQPIVLRPSGVVEQPKTLKCAECGAMNYPTEWYCERCGAELASL